MQQMSSLRRYGKVPMVGAVLLAALMVLVLPAGFSGATPAPADSTPQTLWAYGGVETLNFQGTSHGWQYVGNATYGYSVILNQTNTSATSFELTVNRTMGALDEVHYCYPSCRAPIYFGNQSFHVYETIAASTNLSTTGSVAENGTQVPALALNGSASRLRANVTEASSSYLPIGGLVGTRSHYISANVVATSTIRLTPGLGILPAALASAQSWNSSSHFAAQATANYTWYGAVSDLLGSEHEGPNTGNFSVPTEGTVSLFGSYSPSDSVVLSGVPYPEVSLRIVGPLVVREGFILLPAATDLFGGGNQPWTTQQNDSATASMNYLDARRMVGAHLGFGASQWVYDSSTATPASAVPGVSGATGIAPALTGATDSAPTTTVQGLPETVPSAQSQQNCLVTGSGCPVFPSSGSGGLRGLVGLLAVGVVVLVVAAAVLLVAGRRRMPPPAYPNAALYPPGTVRPGARAPPSPLPAPAEDDPLRNLW